MEESDKAGMDQYGESMCGLRGCSELSCSFYLLKLPLR